MSNYKPASATIDRHPLVHSVHFHETYLIDGGSRGYDDYKYEVLLKKGFNYEGAHSKNFLNVSDFLKHSPSIKRCTAETCECDGSGVDWGEL